MTVGLEPPPVDTLNRLLDIRADRDDGRTLLQVGNEHRTATQLRASAATAASALLAHGVRPGDRVAAIADNCIELVELWLACTALGAILVPINTAAKAMQLDHILRDSEPTIAVTAPKYLTRMTELGHRPDFITGVWSIGDPNDLEWDGLAVTPFPRDGAVEAPPHKPEATATAALLYTSGTTGPAKGVMCPHTQLYWWGVHTARALGVTESDVLYTCLPLFHINALNTVVQSLVSGATAVIGPRFSASRFWQRLIEAEATATYLLGAMVSILAAQPESSLDRAHKVRVALGPATPAQLWPTFQDRFGVRLVEGHGMTETNLAIGPRDGQQRPGWMGRVMPGFHARVVTDSGGEVPAGTPGELLLRADSRDAFATGYWRDSQQTDGAWAGGWFHTGDRVVRDEEGYIRFVDRLKDVIRRRGENISAWEVEQALEAHPAIATAAVVPVPSDLGEDEVMAFVVQNYRATTTPLELVRHCEPRLAYFAIPRYIDVVEKLPLTENGKVQKYLLRERGVTATTWDREREGVRLNR